MEAEVCDCGEVRRTLVVVVFSGERVKVLVVEVREGEGGAVLAVADVVVVLGTVPVVV